MIDRISAILMKFKKLYGSGEGVGLARAPGRVNVIGEHTDYNQGFVMPMAIARDTVVAFKPNGGRRVNAYTLTLEESAGFELGEGPLPASPGWLAYVGGVARVLEARGVELPGVDLVIHTTLPVGGGLSSSAALEVGCALAFLSAAGAEIDRRDLAVMCQTAEADYAGMRCGVMDQYVALFGEPGCVVKLDCRSVRHELVPCATDVAKFVVCDTGVRHELASSEYNNRRQECEAGAALAAKMLADRAVQSLRDVEVDDLPELEGELDEVVFRRVRHVVTENARVIGAAQAMCEQNYLSLGVLMDASHESLRDEYQVSCAELDAMVEIAWARPGVYGSRMTGGGFGGCTISLVDAEKADAFCESVARGYEERTGIVPSIYVCAPEKGAELIRPAS